MRRKDESVDRSGAGGMDKWFARELRGSGCREGDRGWYAVGLVFGSLLKCPGQINTPPKSRLHSTAVAFRQWWHVHGSLSKSRGLKAKVNYKL